MMPREEQDQPIRIEHRGPVVLAILGVLFVLAMLPSRVRLFPTWTPYAIGTGLLLPLVGTWLSGGRPRWLWLERVTTIAFSVLAEALTLTTLFYLIHEMLNRPVEFSGRQLFMSSVAAWVTNVLTFSLLYWRIDCGGPEARIEQCGREARLALSAGECSGSGTAGVAADLRGLPVHCLHGGDGLQPSRGTATDPQGEAIDDGGEFGLARHPHCRCVPRDWLARRLTGTFLKSCRLSFHGGGAV